MLKTINPYLKNQFYLMLIVALFAILFVYGLTSSTSFILKISLPFDKYYMAIEVLVIIWAFYFRSYKIQFVTIIMFCFLGLDYVLLATPIIIMPKLLYKMSRADTFKLKRPQILITCIFIYAFILSISTSYFDFAPLNNLFWIMTFGSGPILFLYFTQYKYEEDFTNMIMKLLTGLIIIQMVLVLYQGGLKGGFVPGDWGVGTLKNVNKVCFWEMLLLLSLTLNYFVDSKRSVFTLLKPKIAIPAFILLIFIFLTESKTTYLFIFAGSVIFFYVIFFVKVFIRYKTISLIKPLVIVGISLTVGINIVPIMDAYLQTVLKSGLTLEQLFTVYTQSKDSAYKYVFYERVFSKMLDDEPSLWVFGTGPGKLGSRASNTLATDVLHKEKQKIPAFIPAHSSPWVKKYMGDLWDEEISRKSNWRSATLSFPFAGIASIKGEQGIIGLVLYILLCLLNVYCLIKCYNDCTVAKFRQWMLALCVAWLTLPIMMVIDNFQEQPQYIIPMFVLTGLLFNTVLKQQNQPSISSAD